MTDINPRTRHRGLFAGVPEHAMSPYWLVIYRVKGEVAEREVTGRPWGFVGVEHDPSCLRTGYDNPNPMANIELT